PHGCPVHLRTRASMGAWASQATSTAPRIGMLRSWAAVLSQELSSMGIRWVKTSVPSAACPWMRNSGAILIHGAISLIHGGFFLIHGADSLIHERPCRTSLTRNANCEAAGGLRCVLPADASAPSALQGRNQEGSRNGLSPQRSVGRRQSAGGIRQERHVRAYRQQVSRPHHRRWLVRVCGRAWPLSSLRRA